MKQARGRARNRVGRWGMVTMTATAAALVWAAAVGAEEKPPPGKPAAEKPWTYKVTRGELKEQVRLGGTFEARRAAPVSLAPKAWASLKIVRVVPHGTRVRKGDVLIELETKKLDKAIGEKADAVRLGEIALKQAVEELRVQEKLAADRLEQVKLAYRRAVEDDQRYEKVERALERKATDAALKYRRDALEYAREELRQLEKMYQADELTEETEEIVLKRQRNAVQRAELALEQAQAAHEKAVKFELPRKEQDRAFSRRAREETYRSRLLLTPLALEKKRLEVAQAKREHAAAVQGLEKLRADRRLMPVRAPMAGIVYYGQCDRGKWTTGATVAPKLIPGGTLTPRQVVMTVVDPGEMIIRCTAEEKDLHRLAKGLRGEATPTGYPQRRLNVQLAEFSTVPLPGGSYDVQLRLLDKPAGLNPGMTCRVVLTAFEKKGVLTVPAGAVHAEGKEKFVWLKTPGRPQRRLVRTGVTRAGKTEILEGLSVGEEVFLEEPK